jgi:hypothetical protein
MTKNEPWGAAKLPLTLNEVAEEGHMACVDTATGLIVKGQTGTTLIPIGYFAEGKTGDGVTGVKIRLFREVFLHWWENDTDTPVLATDFGSEVYIKDSHTVSKDSTGRSKGGRVWGVSPTDGVLVEAGPAVTGPTGAATGSVASVADRDALKAIAAANRADGKMVMVRTDGSLWRFVAASTLTSDEALELAIEPTAGTGCWIRADKAFVMKLPLSAANADHDELLTIPEGFAVRLAGLPYWEVAEAFDGGSASAIGVASSRTGFTAAGAVLGGAAGDVAATLVAGIASGTIGTGFDSLAEIQAALFEEGDIFYYEEITSAFTSGSGFVCLPVYIATAPATP